MLLFPCVSPFLTKEIGERRFFNNNFGQMSGVKHHCVSRCRGEGLGDLALRGAICGALYQLVREHRVTRDRKA